MSISKISPHLTRFMLSKHLDLVCISENDDADDDDDDESKVSAKNLWY